MADESLIAVFVDFENLAIGVGDMKPKHTDFKIELVLKRLLEKGRIVFKRAYCDWSGYQHAVREFHAKGIELVDIPRSRASGKNSADIHMVVDAMDLCYSKTHIDSFALLSGDSDFSPLVSKLKENRKRVIGCGIRNSTSDLLIAGCDEFIFYDDLAAAAHKSETTRRPGRRGEDKNEKVVDQLVDIVQSLVGDYDPLWGSIVKQAMRRVSPGFNEAHYGYNSFLALLKDAESRGLIEVEYDESRGNCKIRLKEAARG
jgi:uncharacterized protein (TIGR00288 family)